MRLHRYLISVLVGVLLGGALVVPIEAQGPVSAQITRALQGLGLIASYSTGQVPVWDATLRRFAPGAGGLSCTAGANQVLFENGSGDCVGDADLTFSGDTLTATKITTGDGLSLLFGGTTSSFPALKRNGAALEVKLADDSAYAVLTPGSLMSTAANTRIIVNNPAGSTSNSGISVYVAGVEKGAYTWSSVGGIELWPAAAGSIGTFSVLNTAGNVRMLRIEPDETGFTFLPSGTSNPATTGAFRLPNASLIGWRNAANSANHTLGVNASDYLRYTGGHIVVDSNFGLFAMHSGGASVGAGIDTTTGDALDFYSGAAVLAAKLTSGGIFEVGTSEAGVSSTHKFGVYGSGAVNTLTRSTTLDAELITSEVDSGGVGTFGAIGMATNHPLYVRTNNTRRALFPAAGGFQIGAIDNILTLTDGALGMAKITASGTAPGAAGLKLEVVCGTNAGSAKIVAYAGTSTTAVTVLDNIGSGVTGC